MSSENPCICGSKKSYMDCCGRFLEQGKQAKTAEQLMRSRYAAYALGGHGQYLLDTWFPATAQGLNAADLSLVSHQWVGLEVLGKQQKGDDATVEFEASFFDAVKGETMKMYELSAFKRIKGRWFYVGAEVLQEK